jgi:hypothetical protein
MPATKLMLIRHAEKPDGNETGIDLKGKPDEHELTVRGWQRAGALVPFFADAKPGRSSSPIERPAVIFATAAVSHSESKRPLHTVTPLAQRLGIGIDSDFAEGSEEAMLKRAVATDGAVLICWHHEAIPAIANLILQAQTAPQKWPGDRFDVVWIFVRDAANARWSFSQMPQQLLHGDAPTVIGSGG